MLTFISRTEQSPVGEITAIHVLNFRTSLRERDFYILGTLRGFFKQLHGFRLVGVTVDAIKLLNEMRIPGNIKGEAVRTLDPKNGPYTDIELYAIHSALDQAYQDSVIDIREFLLAWVSIALAPRPIQFATMKVCDVSYTSTDDGTVSYFLQVPRAKQRYARAREEFHPRIIVPRVGQLLLEYAKSVEHQFAGILPNPHMAPLFPSTEGRKKPPVGFEYHLAPATVGTLIQQIFRKLGVSSERDGLPIHATATRNRRALGTRAVAEGLPDLVIADLMDHQDTQNIIEYTQAAPAFIERIDKAVAFTLAPLARAFAGIIIEDEQQAARAGDPSSRICGPQFAPSMKPMGSCATSDPCNLFAPVACYTCRKFQPWVDGPHEAVLDRLIAERDRFAASCDLRVAAVNDRAILAVAEVVLKCKEFSEATEDGRHV
jgi:integrase